MVWLWLLFGGPIVALILRQVLRIPRRPKLLHTPYARPGPWRILKILAARAWLVYKLIRHPKVLNTYDTSSKKYEKVGIVANELEKLWELPHILENRESCDGMVLHATDGGGTFLKISLNRMINRQAQVSLLLILPDGTSYELPNAPDVLISNTDGAESFNAAGIRFEMIEAMRRWRIIFHGLAVRTRNGEKQEVHLRINMLWMAFSRPFEFKREFSRKLLAQSMSRELWRGRKEWTAMSEPLLNGVDQWGCMSGTYQDFSSGTELELYLRGLRQRRWGQSNPTTMHRKMDLIGTCEDGNYFYLNATSDSERLTHEVWGHVYHPNGNVYKINSCNLDLEKLGENGPMPRHFSLRFSAKRHSYHAIICLMPQQFDSYTGRPWQHRATLYPCHVTLNCRQGRVLLTVTNTFHGDCPLQMNISVPYLASPKRAITIAERQKIVLSLDEESCSFEELVGAKAASLALLRSGRRDAPVPYSVPDGFCLTAAAWRRQLNALPQVKDTLERICRLAGAGSGDLEEACHEVCRIISQVSIDDHIVECVDEVLRELFQSGGLKRKFAVRSSAVGEDSRELSCAGMNATFLGCQGHAAVLKSVLDCWASLFSYQSVEYRRRHGMPLMPDMGVVVQEMVDAEAAGVVFSVDPIDGDPSQVIVTSNFGLGESVVSGRAEPDTITVRRTFDGQLSVGATTLGAKLTRTVLSDDGGVVEQDVEQSQSERCSLDEPFILQLAQLAVYMEKAFGGPRDLEFAVKQGSIHLLQARPITSLNNWTERELIHEFDSAVVNDSEYFTKANVGEVFPSAGTPLTISTLGRILELGYQTIVSRQYPRLSEINPWTSRFFGLQSGQAFLNVVESFLRVNEPTVSETNHVVDMAVFGHLVTTPAMHRIGVQRFGVAGLHLKMLTIRTMFRDFFFNLRRLQRTESKFANYSFNVDGYADSGTLYGEVSLRLADIMEIGLAHMTASRASVTSQILAFGVLGSDWSQESMSDISHMLSSIGNVESADVPTALKELAKKICSNGQESTLCAKSAEEAVAWLESVDSGDCGRHFRSFMQRHGHRCALELELETEPWVLNPYALVSVLQVLVANPQQLTSVARENEDFLAKLRVEKPGWRSNALAFILPQCRKAVIGREKTKSLLVRTVHSFRMAYRQLAKLLVAEGRIVDEKLIFYMTHSELSDVVSGASNATSIVDKAIRRKKLHPKMAAVQFPEVVLGVPKPAADVPVEEQTTRSDCLQLSGTPVCRGLAKGPARVVVDLSDARNIKCGDILITRSTDIGWSPYFPLLAGVVTEIGGLISHGAVIAREYGLPCIVGVQKATSLFRSDDIVVLDGTLGTLSVAQ